MSQEPLNNAAPSPGEEIPPTGQPPIPSQPAHPEPRRRSSVEVQGLSVDADLLTRCVAPCTMGVCGGQCCRFGAIVDPPEIERIEALVPRLLPLLRPAARRVIRRHHWVFRQWVRERYADPGKRFKATRVADGLCVFVLDRQTGGCALHRLALEDGVPVEQYKPRECILFPLSDVVGGRVHLHRWSGYPCTTENADHQPAWRTFSHELKLILGEAGYRALDHQLAQLEQEGWLLEPVDRSDPAPVPRGRPPRPSDALPAPGPADPAPARLEPSDPTVITAGCRLEEIDAPPSEPANSGSFPV